MTKAFEITARNSAHLSLQMDRFNAGRADQVHVNWGREGDRRTWYAHAEFGRGLKTHLSFAEVVDYVQRQIDLALEFDAKAQ